MAQLVQTKIGYALNLDAGAYHTPIMSQLQIAAQHCYVGDYGYANDGRLAIRATRGLRWLAQKPSRAPGS